MPKAKSKFLEDISRALDGSNSPASNQAKVRTLFNIIKIQAQTDSPEGEEIWQKAVDALVALNQTELVLAFLADENADIRQAASIVLGKSGDVKAVKPLMARLSDHEDAVRMSAMEALAELGAVEAVAPVISIFKNELEPSDVRFIAAETLATLGTQEAFNALKWADRHRASFNEDDYWNRQILFLLERKLAPVTTA
jgi:HEAT repeat protein